MLREGRRRKQLLPEEIRHKEPDVRRAFRKAAHEVGIPLRAKWNVNAHGVTFFHESFLQVAADAVEHLKFDGVFGKPYFFGILFCEGNSFFVM